MKRSYFEANEAKNSQQPDTPPVPLTKKWLAHFFACTYSGEKINQGRFYALVLTPEVLACAGLTQSQVRNRKFKTFTVNQSRKIIAALFEE
jgi:hypothetical protein